jgi:Tfp pilus assembly protein PilF
MTQRLQIAIVASAVMLAACQTEPVKEFTSDAKSAWGQLTGSSSKGQSAFNAGLKQYDDGDYLPAAKSLQTALDQGLSTRDQVTAHKYLAFIHCSENRTARCREEFRKALALDPSMDLTAAEVGHPIWGPIFQNVKAGR